MNRLIAFVLLCVAALSAGARGLQFAEEMRGTAYVDGEYRPASVALKVVINDIDAWRVNQNVPATVTGTLYIDRLPSQPVSGTLAILAPAPGDDGRLLTYRLTGTTHAVTGVKHVRDQMSWELIDDMTTLRAVALPKSQPAPSINDLLYNAVWTSEIHFEWWNPSVVWNFSTSFSTINTPWYDVLEVYAIFVVTVFGALADVLFPWLV